MISVTLNELGFH